MAGHIPWSKVDLTLRAQRSIWVSTTRPDGRPHAVPVWYVWDGGSIYFITGRTSQKARNLAAQPSIVVHAGDGDDVIILHGEADLVTEGDEIARIDALYGDKYVAPRTGERATVTREADALYRVRVRRVMTWEYGIVATRTDWTFPPAGGSAGAAVGEQV